MPHRLRAAFAALPLLLAACAATPEAVPPPISAQELATYRLTAVEVDATDAAVVWPAREIAYAASRGVRIPREAQAGGPDGSYSGESIAQQAAYDAFVASTEAMDHLREQAVAAMQPAISTALAPDFTGTRPLTASVDLDAFVIRSTGAVALGAQEGAKGTVTFTDLADGRVVATLPDVTVATQPASPGIGGGSLLGIAVSLATVAAINMASDAMSESHVKVSEGFAQQVRRTLQLPDRET